MKKILNSALIIITLVILLSSFALADGNYRGDKVGLFQDIEINSDSSVRGNIIGIFGDVKNDGEIFGNVVTIFGDVDMNGTVKGNVVSIFGSINMKGNSRITGNRVQVLGGTPLKSRNSIVVGNETDLYFDAIVPNLSVLMIVILSLLALKAFLSFIFSLILVAVVPDRLNNVVDSIGFDIVRRFGIGLLTSVIYVVSLVILSAIIIGLPLIPVLILVMFLLGFGGNTAIKIAIGRKISKGKWSLYTELIVGTIIYTLLELTIILKPILYLAKLVGIGAIVDTKIGTVYHWGENNKKEVKIMINDEIKEDKENIDNEG